MGPEHRATIARSNMRNVANRLRDPENLLFLFWEYQRTDFEADAATLKSHPDIQRWRVITDKMQQPLSSTDSIEHWAPMQEVFYTDQQIEGERK